MTSNCDGVIDEFDTDCGGEGDDDESADPGTGCVCSQEGSAGPGTTAMILMAMLTLAYRRQRA